MQVQKESQPDLHDREGEASGSAAGTRKALVVAVVDL